MAFGILESILIIICFTLVTTLICRFMKLPVVIGYLIVGSMIGPHALGWVDNTSQIKLLAEFGVVLMMFTVGLEFSLSSLMALKKSVFLVGALQVILTTTLITWIGWILHTDLIAAFVMGSIVAMSSTAIVLKQLTDQQEINTKHGLHAIGILLFQDIAVIPMLVIISALSTTSTESFSHIILTSLGKGILVIAGMLLIGRYLLRPLFHLITKTQQIELFTLTVILVSVSSAWLTHKLGLSYALGAFIAGIMLAECEYKHQIKVEIRPFRDLLLGLFFISIGMLVNVSAWSQTWPWILLMVSALIGGKSIVIFLISLSTKYRLSTALRSSLILAQGGEFGFAILTIALTNNLLQPDWGQSILAGMLICFVISPIIIRYNKQISQKMLPTQLSTSNTEMENKEIQTEEDEPMVILCGFGRVGETVALFLDALNQPYIGIEINPSLVKKATKKGHHVIYGDASHPQILKELNIKNAKALIISYDKLSTTENTLKEIRRISKKTPIIARSQHESERSELLNLGATTVVTAMFEESLAFANYLMTILSVPNDTIERLINKVKKAHYS